MQSRYIIWGRGNIRDEGVSTNYWVYCTTWDYLGYSYLQHREYSQYFVITVKGK